MSRTLFSIALAACAFLLVQTASGNITSDFLQEMDEEIAESSFSLVDSGYPQGTPEDITGYPEIWGWCYWPDPDSAPCTWVMARSADSSNIRAWSHSSWPVDRPVPHSHSYYVFNTWTPQPIQYNHRYYLKGLHWLPRTVYDWPDEDQGGPIPPAVAQGVVHSPTYRTQMWHNDDIFRWDVCLSGPAAMW